MRFSLRTILITALLVSCVLAIAVIRRNHRVEVAALQQEIGIAETMAERLTNARMLVRLMKEKETLSDANYREIAYASFCMFLDSGKNVEEWDHDDLNRIDTAGCLLAYLGIEKTDDFMQHATQNRDWGIGDAEWLEDTNLVEIAIASSDHHIVNNADKIWKPDQD